MAGVPTDISSILIPFQKEYSYIHGTERKVVPLFIKLFTRFYFKYTIAPTSNIT